MFSSIVDEPTVSTQRSRKSKSNSRNTRTSNSNSITVSLLVFRYDRVLCFRLGI